MSTRVERDMERMRMDRADTRTEQEQQADIIAEKIIEDLAKDSQIIDQGARLRRAGGLLSAIGGSGEIGEQIVNGWKRRVNALLGMRVFRLDLDRLPESNNERAERVAEILSTAEPYCNDDEESSLRDLMTDVMHLCDRDGYDFNGLIQTARGVHAAEKGGN